MFDHMTGPKMRHDEPTHVVGLDEVTGEHPAGTDTTVIGALGTGETHLGPAKDLAVGVEEGVLLLETEPRLLGLGGVHDLLAVRSVVGIVGGAVVVVALAEDEDVGATTERVLEDGDGALRRVSGGNPGGNNSRGGLTRKTSELSPGAWLVDEPSKFHSLSSETEAGAFSRVWVLHRRPPSPSIQMSEGSAAAQRNHSWWLVGSWGRCECQVTRGKENAGGKSGSRDWWGSGQCNRVVFDAGWKNHSHSAWTRDPWSRAR